MFEDTYSEEEFRVVTGHKDGHQALRGIVVKLSRIIYRKKNFVASEMTLCDTVTVMVVYVGTG